MDPEKKISFGFSKLSKKPAIVSKPKEKQVEFVDRLEGQSIKLKIEQQIIEKEPLVIPLRDNKKDLMDRVRDMKAKQKSKSENMEIEDTRPDSELTEDELAAREVIKDAKLRLAGHHSTGNKVFVLPIKTESELPLEGEKESTFDDYENVPVSDFGLAMLRGMGWKEGVGIGKNAATTSLFKPPELRPKGLGLGASAVTNSDQQNKQVADKNGEILILKNGSYAKIVAGNQKGSYCEVQGLDDEAGRIVVKTTLKGNVLTLNEFMLVAVTKEEYSKNSKMLNLAKFDEYKEKEQKKYMHELKHEKREKYTSSIEDKYKPENGTKTKSEKNIVDCEKSEANYKKSINIKPEKASDDEPKNSKKEKSKQRKKDRGDSSDSDSDYEKSRKTHKRKDKKRHRDKSRSPNRKYKSSRKLSRSKHRYSSSDSDSRHEPKHDSYNRSENDNRHKRRNKKHF